MKSIRFKLWAGMMALVVIVLLLLWLFQVVFLESFYTNMRISNVKDEAANIITLINEGKALDSEDRLEAFAYNNNLNIELLDGKGNIISIAGSSGGQMPMMKNSVRIEAFQDALRGKETALSLLHPRFGNKFILLGIPVKTGGTISGALLINMPLAPVEETAAIIKEQLIYITLVLLVASLVISFLISRSFTRPLLEIKKVSETMASGDFSARISAGKQDEIGELARTINYMGEQLSQIDQLRKDLIANVSHELRTPLSLIRGYAETLRDVSGNNPAKRERQLGIIIDETERLSQIVNDILNLSQLQSGNIKLNKNRFSLREKVEGIIKRYDVLKEKTGVELTGDIEGSAILEADEARIEQVLYNLINNAFKHTPSGGKITVRALEQKNALRLEVSDTGSGIAKEELSHVWERFYKTDKTGNTKLAGTGLGLAIVKEVLEAHKALYGIESTLGEGTTIWFEIPKR